MRIVITKNGKIIFKELEDETPSNLKLRIKSLQTSSYSKLPIIYTNEDLLKRFNNKSINNKFILTVLRNKEISNKRRSHSLINKKNLENFFTGDESKMNSHELNKMAKYKTIHSKTNISQFFLDKYDALDDNYRKKLLDFDKLFERNEKKTEEDDNNMETNIDNKNSINPLTNINNKISQLNSSTGRNNNNSSIFSIKKTKKINIGDIISKRNLYTLRKQISKYNKGSNDVRVPLDENNLKSYNFRSRYENKQATGDDMDLILNYGINTDKPGIIKYFQQNKTINPQYYENLIIYDEYRMNKLNKILEIMMKNKEKEESKNKFSLLSKLDDKNRNGGLHLKKIENLIKKSGSIINERSSFTEKMKYWRKKAYEEDTENINKKYWIKYDVDRFLKHNQKRGSSNISLKNIKIKKLYSSQSCPNVLSEN